MKVRKATMNDDAEICALAKPSPFTRYYGSLNYIRDDIANIYEKGFVGIVRQRGKLVGFVYARHLLRKPFTSIYYLATDKEQRCKGVGRALIEWALKTSPHKRLELICELRNKEGLAFYDRLGFTKMEQDDVKIRYSITQEEYDNARS